MMYPKFSDPQYSISQKKEQYGRCIWDGDGSHLMGSVMYKKCKKCKCIKKVLTAFANGTDLGTSPVQKGLQFTQEKVRVLDIDA